MMMIAKRDKGTKLNRGVARIGGYYFPASDDGVLTVADKDALSISMPFTSYVQIGNGSRRKELMYLKPSG